MLSGKKIIVAVTGSIAVYKSVYLVRLLVQHGADVRVVMSPGALQFITPLTFSTVSSNPVVSDFTEDADQGTWTKHVELALWADLLVIAPLSANTLSKMVHGQSDNFLLAMYMSTRCRVMVAPAMDHDMYLHPGTRQNLSRLKEFGHQIIEPSTGELASGLVGMGRMAEPDQICESVVRFFNPDLPLTGKRAMVTAGPTYERIDPVRFIGNFSSGKMGFALADELAALGAQVTLIAGPSHQQLKNRTIRRLDVESAAQMADTCKAIFPEVDMAIMAAAVADYRPTHPATEKIKKSEDHFSLELERTEDIAATLSKLKRKDQLLIGFALETEHERENAENKMLRKNMDLIVLNSLRDEGAGFGLDTNKISLLSPGNNWLEFGLMPKAQIAATIVKRIVELIKA